MITMLFTTGSMYAILTAEVGIVDSQRMKFIAHHYIGFRKPTQYFYSSYIVSDFHRHSLNSCVATSRTSLQGGKEKAMCVIHMRVQCSDKFSEVIVEDVEHTELTIESILGTALLEVFDNVHVENVTVQPSSEGNDG